MRAFSKRYLVWISLILLGFSGFSFNNKNLIFLPLFLLIIGVIYLILRKNKEKHKNLPLVALCLALAAVVGVLGTQALKFSNAKKLEKYEGYHLIEGFVKEVSYSSNYACEYIVKVERVDGKASKFNLIVQTDYQTELNRGDFFQIDATISATADYTDNEYLQNVNVYDHPLIAIVDENNAIEHLDKEFRPSLMLANLNSKFSAILQATMGTKNGSLASALLLGNRELLPFETLRDFKRAGVYHLLALSGMHVAILIGILEFILKKLYFSTKLRIVLLALVSIFYLGLTGFALSATRSILMLWVVYLSMLVQRKRDVMTSLFIAASVIVLIKPSAVLDVGLQLSFLSTFGVICSSMIWAKLKLFKSFEEAKALRIIKSVLSKILLMIVATICVFVCTLPVIMIYFGEVSLATFFTNIISGFVCEIFMVLALLTLIFSRVLWLYPIFALFANLIGNVMTKIVESIADIKNVMLSLNYPFANALVWLLFVLFIFMLAIHLGRKWMIFTPCVAFTVAMIVGICAYNGARADFVRTEFYLGDGLVLSSKEGVYIVDMSDGTYSHLYEGLEIAKENCFTEIDGVILTHYHSEYVYSLQAFAKKHKIRSVYLPMPQNSSEATNMSGLYRVLENVGVEVYIYRANENLNVLGGDFVVSDRAFEAGYAHPSIAVSFSFGEKRISVLQRKFFDSYLYETSAFKSYIQNSDYIIFGSDGRKPLGEYEIYSDLKEGCEVSFADFEFFNLSDLETHIDEISVYLNVYYKKYDIK